MSSQLIPVIAGGILPGQVPHKRLEVACGTPISQMVREAFPGLRDAAERLRVHLVGAKGDWLIKPQMWPHVKPRAGTTLVIRSVPGRDELRQVLTIVVSVAALTFGGPLAASLGFAGTFAASLATAGLTIAGTLLVNALIPIQQPSARGSASETRRNVFSIQGWRNDARPGEHLPSIFGQIRYAPPFAATSYTEIVDDQQFVRALFAPGYGPLTVSDMRIGDTPIDEFDDVEVEIREGRDGDLPVSLFPRQVLEEAAGIQLVRPFPRSASGEIVEGAASVSTPVTRFTARDAAEASVILSFPQGLFRVDDEGDVREQSVTVRIRQRLEGVGGWTTVETMEIASEKRETIFRQHTWALPSRGRWQIEVERISDEPTETNRSDTVVWSALQSIRPEYPINMPVPIPLIAVRVRATYQLNGTLDQLNAQFAREMPVYDAVNGWQTGTGRNPASAYLAVLQGAENPYPADDTAINFDEIAEWYEYCVDKGLKFDFVQDEGASLAELLSAICAAGRATPRHDGQRWGVVVDRPDLPVIEHVNDRNADQFSWSRPYLDPPDGFRVTFFDETNDYQIAERIVPWPGFVGEPVLTEEIALPGKTDPDEIWRESRRRMYELIHRPVTYSAMTSMRSRVATRGDKVMASFNEIEETHLSVRVRSVDGSLVVLDDIVDVGTDLGVRFKVPSNDEDIPDQSVVRTIADVVEASSAIRLTGDGEVPQVGQVIHVGPISNESTAMRVLGIEGADDFNSRMIMVADAPIIDDLTDAEIPPAWNGRVGAEFGALAGPPAEPSFTRIASGPRGWFDDTEDTLFVRVREGVGSIAPVTRFEIEHRLSGTSSWTTETVSAAARSIASENYSLGDDVEIRARAFNATDSGDFTDIVNFTIGEDALSIPSEIPANLITVSVTGDDVLVRVAVPNRANFNFGEGTWFEVVSGGGGSGSGGGSSGSSGTGGTSSSVAVTSDRLQIYRVASGGTLDRDDDVVSSAIAVRPGETFEFTDSTVGTGTFDYYIEPQNNEGVAGPISGPYEVTIS